MQNTQRRGIPIIWPVLELERTFRRMNQNSGIQGDEVDPQMQPLVDTHDPVLLDIFVEDKKRRQPPAPRPQEYYRGYENIADSDGPLIFPPLPHGQTFVVTSSLMQMLIVSMGGEVWRVYKP